MRGLVVDIESTCWKGNTPEGMESEIIEVGICLLDIHTGEITDNRGILVKPKRSSISDFCTELTTITQEMVEAEGISFKEALKIIRNEYQAPSRVWASYGAYDMNQFRKQCTDQDRGYPFGATHFNVKSLFAIKHRLKQEVGMATALEMLQLELEGTHHRGVDDARNIAKILQTLI